MYMRSESKTFLLRELFETQRWLNGDKINTVSAITIILVNSFTHRFICKLNMVSFSGLLWCVLVVEVSGTCMAFNALYHHCFDLFLCCQLLGHKCVWLEVLFVHLHVHTSSLFKHNKWLKHHWMLMRLCM